MSRRRVEVLKELKLWPVWRLRRGGQGAGSAQEGPPLTPAPSAGRHESSLPLQGKGQEGGRGNNDPARAAKPSAGALQERRALILEMDWQALKARVARCADCPLHRTRTQTVFGVGDEKAQWLFVGEGPGAEEDARGEPFVGPAGKLLDNMLAAIKLKRGENVYIANVVKCRPPGNRNPQPLEMERCEPYLERQIELIRPKLIVALGRIAAQSLLKSDAPIASLRGRVHSYQGIPLIVTYHPAYLLRNLPDKAKAWVDLCFARETLARLQSGKPAPDCV